MSATFKVTSGPAAFNGDLVANGLVGEPGDGREANRDSDRKSSERQPGQDQRVATASSGNPTDSFIELYNAGDSIVDISGWTLTEHPIAQPVLSSVKIPAGTKLASQRLLPARTGQLRVGGPRAQRRYHPLRQEHDRHERRRHNSN